MASSAKCSYIARPNRRQLRYDVLATMNLHTSDPRIVVKRNCETPPHHRLVFIPAFSGSPSGIIDMYPRYPQLAVFCQNGHVKHFFAQWDDEGNAPKRSTDRFLQGRKTLILSAKRLRFSSQTGAHRFRGRTVGKPFFHIVLKYIHTCLNIAYSFASYFHDTIPRN